MSFPWQLLLALIDNCMVATSRDKYWRTNFLDHDQVIFFMIFLNKYSGKAREALAVFIGLTFVVLVRFSLLPWILQISQAC